MESLKVIGCILITYTLTALSFVIGTEVVDWMRRNGL